MRLTVEKSLDDAAIDLLYDVYSAAFADLRTHAAARHVLTRDEFTAEMRDDRIDKYVVWEDDDRPVGLSTLTTDLAAVPWISAAYYLSRYPDQAERGALFYLGYTLVHPDYEGQGITARILARIARRLKDSDGVCGFDVSAHNDGRHHMGASMGRLTRTLPMTLSRADVQTYYVLEFAAG